MNDPKQPPTASHDVEPAIDREFGVIDFLIVLDVEALDDRTHKRMFGCSRPAAEAASAYC